MAKLQLDHASLRGLTSQSVNSEFRRRLIVHVAKKEETSSWTFGSRLRACLPFKFYNLSSYWSVVGLGRPGAQYLVCPPNSELTVCVTV